MLNLANPLKHSTLNEPGTITYEEEEDGGITTNYGPTTRVGLVVHKAEDGIAARANNLYNYLDINRRVRKNIQVSLRIAGTYDFDAVLGARGPKSNGTSSEEAAYRSKGSDIDGLGHWAIDTGGRACERQEIHCWPALCDRQDDQDRGVCDS